jgi:hypothetical protein
MNGPNWAPNISNSSVRAIDSMDIAVKYIKTMGKP